MRRMYIACYDVSDPGRLRRMFKTMKGFGDPLQYSVFLCVLSKEEKVVMLSRVREIMNTHEDRFMLAALGPEEGRGAEALEYYGTATPVEKRRCVIV